MNCLPFMEQWDMLPSAGGRILVAVSGGRDSMCLLHYLHELGMEKNFTVAAGHLNHAMRPEADSDEAFVRQFCAERGIAFYTKKIPVYEMAKKWQLSVEEAGRRARYDFLEETAMRIGADRIATAHHLGDQAETVLLQLLRGTGPEGLGGIPPVRGKYIRPLLETPREEMEAYNKEHEISCVEDSTNGDLAYARNRLRLSLWPELQKIHPGARENVARCAAIVRRENDYLNRLAAAYLPAEGTVVKAEQVLKAPEVLQSRMVRLLLMRLSAGKKDVGAGHVEAILKCLKTGGMINLPSGMTAICRDGVLRVCIKEEKEKEKSLQMGENTWGGYAIVLSRSGPGDFALKNTAGEFVVRVWQSRDRMTLPGGRGSRSLKKLFTDFGIAPERRDAIPVICVGDLVVHVPGIGTDDSFLPDETDSKIYFMIQKNSF